MKNKITRRGSADQIFYSLSIALLMFSFSQTFAQDVSAKLDQSKIVIGDQVKMQLKVSDINPKTGFIARWFEFQDTSNHIQVAHPGLRDSLEVNGLVSYFQTITITSFDSGTWKIPPLFVIVQNKVNGTSSRLSVPPDSLTVLPVDVSDLHDYHGLKSIIEVKKQPDYWLYALIVITALILFFILRFFLRKQKRKPQPVAVVRDPEDVLQMALRKIKELPLPQQGSLHDAKRFYSAIGAIGKQYLKERFQISADPATTEELILQTGVYLQKEPFRSRFYQLLKMEDVVKFAKYIPSDELNKDARKVLTETLVHLHEFNNHQKVADVE